MEETVQANQKDPFIIWPLFAASVAYQVVKDWFSVQTLFVAGLTCCFLALLSGLFFKPYVSRLPIWALAGFCYLMFHVFFWFALPQTMKPWVMMPVARSIGVFAGITLVVLFRQWLDVRQVNQVSPKKLILFSAPVAVGFGLLEHFLG